MSRMNVARQPIAADARALPRMPGRPFLGSLLDMKNDRVAFQLRAMATGPLVRASTPFFELVFVSSPEGAHEVLVERASSFVKSPGLSVFAKPLLGEGLVTSEHGVHKRQRKMMAPVFVQKHIASYARTMAKLADESTDRMLAAGGAPLDFAEETMRTTLDVVTRTMFSTEVREDAEVVAGALTQAMESMVGAMLSVVPLPPAVPSPTNLAGKRAIRRLDEVIFRLIRERRALLASGAEPPVDLLSLLLAARDEDDGSGMDDRQLRDEAMTIFLAGHETTANAVAWATYLLAGHPDVRARLEAEVDGVLAGRVPAELGAEDGRRLVYTMAVLKEAMRLYPPVYILGRRATEDVTVAGTRLRKGQIVLVNVVGIHRSPALYTDPDRFDPERFLGDAEKKLPKLAYLPFGAGPRVCIGNHFALLEGQLLLAAFAARARFERAPGPPPGLEPLITLRPKGGLVGRVVPRS